MRTALLGFLAGAVFAGAVSASPLNIYTELAPPDQFVGPDGELTGFTVDIVREIQKRVGNGDPIQLVPWVRGYQEALTRPNVVIFGMARTMTRDQLFQWIGPIGEDEYHLYVKADSKLLLKSLDDAKKLVLIGVYKEDVRDQYLTKHGFTNLDRSINEIIMLRKLLDGRIDALVGEPEGIGRIAREAGMNPAELREAFPLFKVQLYIALSKDTPGNVFRSWTAAMKDMKGDGTFEQVFRKYYPRKPQPGPPVAPP